MTPQEVPHGWSAEALLNKSQLYAEVMLSYPHGDWKFTLWSTLSLELLARAALSNFSPTLLADSKGSWHNLLYSLGNQPKAKNFTPKSIDISEVFGRLQELIQDFTPELESFCRGHLSKRNEELHSGNTPFVAVNETSWLPTYYRACAVLLESMKDDLGRFLGSTEAPVAEAMIEAAKDESAKSIKEAINAHKLVWDNNSSEDKESFALQSLTWATRQDGHRGSCPACECVAMLSGSPIAPPSRTITEDEVTETQEYLPSRFECVACGLKITGLSRLSVAGLGDTYNATFTYGVDELFVPEDYYPDYEPDFNEP